MNNLHFSPRYSIARTGSSIVMGLRSDMDLSLCQSEHDGNLDRSAFLATGSTLKADNGLTANARTTTVVLIDRINDFPTKEEREEQDRVARANRMDAWIVERFERDEAAQQFADNI